MRSLKRIVMMLLVVMLIGGLTSTVYGAIDPEFHTIYYTVMNEEREVVLLEEDFVGDTNGVQTFRIYVNTPEYPNIAISINEIRAFEDREGKGENVFLETPAVGGPMLAAYSESYINDGIGFPENLEPSQTNDPVGTGWASKWYSTDVFMGHRRGVFYISLLKPANIKRIEIEMGYKNNGTPMPPVSAFELSVSKESFTVEQLTKKKEDLLRNIMYTGNLTIDKKYMNDDVFKVIYSTNDNKEGIVALTSKDFKAPASKVQTIRIFFNKSKNIRVHEILGFEDEAGAGPNLFKGARVKCQVGNQGVYCEDFVVDGYTIPEEGEDLAGYKKKWVPGTAKGGADTSGVIIISLEKPVDLKRIELYMGYKDNGELDIGSMPAFEISVSDKAFDPEEVKNMSYAIFLNRTADEEL